MLSINTIARVVVNTVRASASPASFDTGLLLVPDANFADNRRLMEYASMQDALAGIISLGFPQSSEVYKAAVKYYAASPAPVRMLLSCYPTSETPSEALDAVVNLAGNFYGVMVLEDLSSGDILLFAQHVEALGIPAVLFAPVMGTPGGVAASGSTLDKLYSARLKRTIPFYCESISDCAAVAGLAMGLELAHRTSAFALCYKTLNGIEPSGLTQAEVNAIKAKNGNVYVARGSSHLLLENGSAAGGQRYDEILYVDKIANDLQNRAVSMLADNPDKMPQTDDSTAQFINQFSAILINYTNMGVLASAAWRGAPVGPIETGDMIENGFALWAGSYDDQSDADRAAHKAVPISIALTLAGSIESIVITVNVQV